MSDLKFFEVFFAFLFGACFGSFANVVIYRLPQNQSLWGRSRCQKCQKPVPWYHNIPMLSYFILKGQCCFCAEKFSIRYPLVEFIMAIAFALTIYLYGVNWTSFEYIILVWGLITASFIDLDHMILPDELTLGGLVIGLIGAFLNPERQFLDALLGVLFGGGILWLVAYVYYIFTGREGLGGGDIKLLGWLGALLGWRSIPFIILSSSVFGSAIGLLVSWKNKDGLKTMIPFGPFLAFGALLYLFGLKSVGLWYVDLFFPALSQ
ncbi:MAG: prepilin peptidase [Bdellovibrionaceae bacterium]|nr:prepilin peptidase [Pseudobdellovibrionaceae bacterium]